MGQIIQDWLVKNRIVVALALVGLFFLGFGIFLFRAGLFEDTKVEVIEATTPAGGDIIVEIAGSVEKPGVYKLAAGARTDDLLIAAGGLASGADREWVGKNLNRAAKVVDGQKIYVPAKGEVASNTKSGGSSISDRVLGTAGGLINLNTATMSELDGLAGIGAVRAQSIIDNRPYSSVDELLTKKVVPKSVFEKIKGALTAP